MFDPKNRIKIDPEANRRSMMPIIIVFVAMGLAICLGVYFGLFVGMRLF